ncbi:MAG: NfeD family protein [Clostridia bacterium]|nr:NfeD family protein [Clostridia bacterium]
MDWKLTALWLGLMLVLSLLEAATTQLVTIWFALGALAALLASILHAPLWLQITLFAVVSTAALILTRPLAKKLTRTDKVPTNADRVLNQVGVVQDAIDNTKACGTVLVGGSVWSARSADGEPIAQGASVTVERIEGVKLIVSVKE